MRVAVVDGYSTGRLVAAMLVPRGVRCVHVQSRSSTHPYYSGTFAAADYEVDLGYDSDPRAVAERLTQLRVDRVVAGTESGVDLAARLGALVGGPHDDPQRSAASADKKIMDDIVRAAGITVPRGKTFTSAAMAVEWMTGNELAAVVAKPTTSAGTDHVRFCTGAAELARACDEILAARNVYGDSNAQVVVQERVDGIEYYLNTVSFGGQHRVAEAWRYSKSMNAAGSPIYDYEEPVSPGSALWSTLRRFVFEVLDALGIRASPAHTEVIIRPDGTPVLIETGARLGGATLPEVNVALLGASQAHVFVESIVDPGSLTRFDEHRSPVRSVVRNVSLINHAPGVVPDSGWKDFLGGLPTCFAINAGLPVGTNLPATSTLIDSPGYLYLASDDPSAVLEDYCVIRQAEADGLYTGSAGTSPVVGVVPAALLREVVAKAVQECQNGLMFRYYDVSLTDVTVERLEATLDDIDHSAQAPHTRRDGGVVIDVPPVKVIVTVDSGRLGVRARRSTRPLSRPPSLRHPAGEERTAPAEALWRRAEALQRRLRDAPVADASHAAADELRAMSDDPSWLLSTMACDAANRLGIPAVPGFVWRHEPHAAKPDVPTDTPWSERWEDRVSVDEYAFYEAVHPGYGSQTYVAAEIIARQRGITFDRMLDIGSGPGLPTIMMSELFPNARIEAVEPSPTAFEHLRANCRGRNIKPHNAGISEFHSAGGFPVIVSVGASHHLDTRQFLANAHNNLLPDGVLVVADEFVAAFRTPAQRSKAIAEHHRVYIEQALHAVIADTLPKSERSRLAVLRRALTADLDELPELLDLARSNRAAIESSGPWQRVRFAVLELEALVAGLDYDVERKTWALNLMDLARNVGLAMVEHQRVHATVGSGEFDAGTHVFAFARAH